MDGLAASKHESESLKQPLPASVHRNEAPCCSLGRSLSWPTEAKRSDDWKTFEDPAVIVVVAVVVLVTATVVVAVVASGVVIGIVVAAVVVAVVAPAAVRICDIARKEHERKISGAWCACSRGLRGLSQDVAAP